MGLQIALDCSQCTIAVLPEALFRQETASAWAHLIHLEQLWLVHEHGVLGPAILSHDWLDHLSGKDWSMLLQLQNTCHPFCKPDPHDSYM